METKNHLNSPDLVVAVRAWTGWGSNTIPVRDAETVRRCFGEDAASKLLPVLDELAGDFYSTNARQVAANIAEMGDLAAADFKAKHPDLPVEIADAFAWCYTFDFK